MQYKYVPKQSRFIYQKKNCVIIRSVCYLDTAYCLVKINIFLIFSYV